MGIRIELDYSSRQVREKLIECGIQPTTQLVQEIVRRMTVDARNTANNTLVDCIEQIVRGETLTAMSVLKKEDFNLINAFTVCADLLTMKGIQDAHFLPQLAGRLVRIGVVEAVTLPADGSAIYVLEPHYREVYYNPNKHYGYSVLYEADLTNVWDWGDAAGGYRWDPPNDLQERWEHLPAHKLDLNRIRVALHWFGQECREGVADAEYEIVPDITVDEPRFLLRKADPEKVYPHVFFCQVHAWPLSEYSTLPAFLPAGEVSS